MSELLGTGLRRHRELAGLTQADLATRAGVSRQLVGAVESGRHLPRVDAAVALAGVLGVEVVELFGTVARVVDVVSGDEPGHGASLRLGWVGDRLVSTPARIGADGWDVADGVMVGHSLKRLDDIRAGVVVAGCEPALETVERLMRQGGLGGVAVPASSAVALEAVVGGRAHAAVVHGPRDALPAAPPGVARFLLAGWRVGLALPDGIGGVSAGTSWRRGRGWRQGSRRSPSNRRRGRSARRSTHWVITPPSCGSASSGSVNGEWRR
jgi:transcriptional regulator with XRE-family HTH domain